MAHTELADSIHGPLLVENTIPFIGRRKELQTITEFCTKTNHLEELAICWIQGEAGIGKSALVQESIQRLEKNDRIVLSVCLYLDSVDSIVALLANTINSNQTIRHLRIDHVTNSLTSVLAALRRLARLRPLVLILEDLHLINKESCTELQTLLHGLRNESIAVLCLSRISNDETYAQLLPYIRTSIEIPPLTLPEIEEFTALPLLHNLQINPGLLLEASRGYPLILHGLILEIRHVSQSNRPSTLSLLQQQQMQLQLHNIAGLSINGLTATFMSRLTEDEKETTRRLTLLGERFAPETAQAILGSNYTLIEHLLQSGIIVRSTTLSLPIYGKQEATTLYRFNHTLVFEQLLQEAVVEPEAMLKIIANDLPLYSLTLFQQLEKAPPEQLPSTTIEQAIGAITETAVALDLRHAFAQKLAQQLCGFAERLFNRYKELFSSEQQRAIELDVNISYVHSCRQQLADEHLIARLKWLDNATASPTCINTAEYRFGYLSNYILHHGVIRDSSLLNEIEQLYKTFPNLCKSKDFIQCLGFFAGRSRDPELLDDLWRIRDLFCQVLAAHNTPALTDLLAFAGVRLVYSMSIMLKTEAGVQETIELANTLRTQVLPQCSPDQARVMIGVLSEAHLIVGRMSEVLEILTSLQTEFKAEASTSMLQLKQFMFKILSAIGAPLEQLEDYLNYLIELHTDMCGMFGATEGSHSFSRSQWELSLMLTVEGFMRGEVTWAENIVKRFGSGPFERLNQVIPLNRAAAEGSLEKLREYKDYPTYGPLVCAATEPLEDALAIRSAKETILTVLTLKMVSVPVLSEYLIVLWLLQRAEKMNPDCGLFASTSKQVTAMISSAINWCLQQQLPGYAIPFLRFAEQWLPTKKHAQLAKKTEALIAAMPDEIGIEELLPQSNVDDRITVSVIGTITASSPSMATQRFQGARLRRGVALIVATSLMKQPLSLAEFRSILTGMFPDAEKAGSYTRTLLWRIRTVLGPNSIITDGEAPPRFSTTLVRVDLFDVMALLERCEQGLREARPRQAREALMQALRIIGAGPIYPTLYDDFFEAARLDFEVHLRAIVRSTVAMLRKEGDLQEAERLLRTALYTLLGDDELMEEHIEILQELGRNTEAVTIREHMKLGSMEQE